MRFSRGKLKQNVLFCVQHFFQNLLFKISFFYKIVLFRNFFSWKSCFLKVYFSYQKTDASYNFQFNIWRVVKKLIPNLTNIKNFYFKIMLLTKIFLSKSCFLEKFFSSGSWFLKLHVIHKKCAFHGVNWIKTCFFVCNIFFRICFLKLIFS